MIEQLTVTTERVDDIPLLLAQIDTMGIPELLDDYFRPHGNWEGMSLGWTTAVWLTHLISQGDHRMNQVQPWVGHRLHTLHTCTRQEVCDHSWSDDRLAIVLDALSDTQKWQQFETALNQRMMRVYNLKPHRVRLDSTTANGYWSVSEDGLFQLGTSRDHRPDLPQRKRDALGPGSDGVADCHERLVAGNRADDPLYLPAIQQVSASLGKYGLLYVGDCKMGALQTRAMLPV